MSILTKGIKFVGRNSPTILTGIAVGGVIITAILAVKAGPKLKKHAKIAKQVKEEMLEEDATSEEMRAQNVKNAIVYLKDLAPTILMGSVTIFCICGANVLHLKKETAMAAAATLAEESYRSLRTYIPEEVNQKIERDIAVSSFPKDRDIIEGEGDLLCFECYTGRFFWCTKEKVNIAEMKANERLAKHYECNMNYFFEWLGMGCVPAGNNIGWATSAWHGSVCFDNEDGIDWINFRHDSFLVSDIPVLMIDYSVDSRPFALIGDYDY